jgi:hypothetical protein
VTRKSRKARRTPIDVLRGRFYCLMVAYRAGIAPTGRALEAHFEPHTIRKTATGTSRSCKWDRYLRGTRLPSPKTVAMVELRYPGTRRWLEWSLWRLLSAEPLHEREKRRLISELHPSVTTYLNRTDAIYGDGVEHVSYSSVGTNQLARIAHEISIDVLPCLLLLLKESQQHNNSYQGIFIDRYLFHAFLRHAQIWFLISREATFDLFRQLRNCVLSVELDREIVSSPWLGDENALARLIDESNDVLIALEDLQIVDAVRPEHVMRTLALLGKGNFYGIAREAISLDRTGKWPINYRRRGLRWLIRQIHGRKAGKVISRLEAYSAPYSQ